MNARFFRNWESKAITHFLLPWQLNMHFLCILIGNQMSLSGTLASITFERKSKPFPPGVSWFQLGLWFQKLWIAYLGAQVLHGLEALQRPLNWPWLASECSSCRPPNFSREEPVFPDWPCQRSSSYWRQDSHLSQCQLSQWHFVGTFSLCSHTFSGSLSHP